MRRYQLILLISLFSFGFQFYPNKHFHIHAQEKTSASLMSQALELLQNNKRPQALKLLEQAFEIASDPVEIRNIGALILEASPRDYAKREAYLRYLIKFAPDHEDYSRWLKELGDKAFDKGNLDDAEDFYLRAIPSHPSPTSVQYRLGWVYWNQKKRVKAYDTFLEVYQKESGALKSQIQKDIAKLWWEIGPLPPQSFAQFLALPNDERNQFLNELFQRTPRKKEDAKLIEQVFLQLKSSPKSSPALKDFITSGFILKEDPCLLFKEVIDPQDLYPRSHLLLCTKQENRPSAAHLLQFYQLIPPPERNETIDWANADLFFENQQKELAVQLLWESRPLVTRSKEFVDYAENSVLQYDEASFKLFESNIQREAIMAFLQMRPKSSILQKLQAVNPELWIWYQENELPQTIDKDFWIKKAVWLGRQEQIDMQALRATTEKAFSFKLTPKEKRLYESLQSLQKRKNSSLPEEFGEKFQSEYKSWINEVDQALNELQSSTDHWKIILRPIFSEELASNIAVLKDEVKKSKMPQEMKGMEVAFERKKQDLREEIDAKYRPFFLVDSTPTAQSAD